MQYPVLHCIDMFDANLGVKEKCLIQPNYIYHLNLLISEFDMNEQLSKGVGKHAKLHVNYINIGLN